MTNALPETVDGLPNISGSEDSIREAIAAAAGRPVYPPDNGVDFGRIRSACAIALHMHQPLIPVGDDLRTAEIASNLKQMRDRGNDEARGNANVFHWCYKRMGEFVPQLVDQGSQPRVMLDYSGTLLWGLRQMGLGDVFDTLRTITCDPRYRDKVEWLGLRLGASCRALDAGAGLSAPPARLAAPLRRAVRHRGAAAGARLLAAARWHCPIIPTSPMSSCVRCANAVISGCWCRSTPSSVPMVAGRSATHLPHRLVCRNSRGETAEIIAIIKTQGSDTKLVAQMQPLYEARSLSRWEIAGRSVPPLVTQIADGENGGVMMNEFPPKYMDVDAGMLGIGRAGDERHGIPGAFVCVRCGGERPRGAAAAASGADLGSLQGGRRRAKA